MKQLLLCRRCGEPFKRRSPRHYFCTPECSRLADLERKRVEPLLIPCRTCGREFVANNPNGGKHKAYCSPPCRRAGHAAYVRAREQAKQAAAPPKHCVDCNIVLDSRKRKRCPACVRLEKSRAARVARERDALNRGARPIERRSSKPIRFNVSESSRGPSFDIRQHDERMRLRRAEIEKLITTTPIETPLPSDPREALVEALDRHPALRRAFAEVHGIQVGRA